MFYCLLCRCWYLVAELARPSRFYHFAQANSNQVTRGVNATEMRNSPRTRLASTDGQDGDVCTKVQCSLRDVSAPSNQRKNVVRSVTASTNPDS